MSDTTTTPAAPAPSDPEGFLTEPEMGTFDEAGEYTPRQVVADDLDGTSLEDAIAGTIVEFEYGDIDLLWEHPYSDRFLSKLEEFSRLILHDRRGVGLS